MQHRFIVLVSIVFLFSTLLIAKGGGKWEEVSKDDRLSLYKRKVPGSDIYEIKAVAYMSGTLKEAVNIIFDRNSHAGFFKYLEVSRQLRKTDSCDWAYCIVSAPLSSDRDYLVKSCHEKVGDNVSKIVWESFTDKNYPENDKHVRVKINNGYWQFTQVKPDEMKIDYYIHTDPGGSLPTFIKNLANKKAVPDTIWALSDEILKRRKK